MTPLPLPLRIAAGLVATAVEQVRDLPRTLVELPVTAVSQTLQASMRVQQRVTELAIKGDRALSVLRPVEEKPSWATFDDEDVPSARPAPKPVPRPAPAPEPARPSAQPSSAQPSTNGVSRLRPEPAPDAAAAVDAAAGIAEVAVASGLVDEHRLDAVEDLDAVADAEAIALIEDAEATEGGITELPEPAVEGLPDLPLPDYPTMTIAQLRGRLRYLSAADLEQLLAFETAHQDRPPYVTMLSNRIATVAGK